jgi:hypothetical protein
MHQKRFARLELAALEHIVPHGEKRLRQGGGFCKGETLRQRQRIAFLHCDKFGVAASIGQCADRIAQPPAPGLGAKRGDSAGHLQSGQV